MTSEKFKSIFKSVKDNLNDFTGDQLRCISMLCDFELARRSVNEVIVSAMRPECVDEQMNCMSDVFNKHPNNNNVN